jgi:hypothetical protein
LEKISEEEENNNSDNENGSNNTKSDSEKAEEESKSNEGDVTKVDLIDEENAKVSPSYPSYQSSVKKSDGTTPSKSIKNVKKENNVNYANNYNNYKSFNPPTFNIGRSLYTENEEMKATIQPILEMNEHVEKVKNELFVKFSKKIERIIQFLESNKIFLELSSDKEDNPYTLLNQLKNMREISERNEIIDKLESCIAKLYN